VLGLAALLSVAHDGGAQTVTSIAAAPVANEPAVTATLSDVTRLESWSFFEPRIGGGDPTYTLLGNRATLAVGLRSRHLELDGALQYSQLLGLPRGATGPGPLGPGPTYFDASRAPNAYQLYIRAISVRVKSASGLSVQAGRMDFTSGFDATMQSAATDALTRARLAGRLIGGADWTPFERAFDGARIDIERPRWRATSALLFPTQGAFEESANPTMSAVRLATGSLVVSGANGATNATDMESAGQQASEFRLFAMHYRDRRGVHTRPDNSGLDALNVDVAISTVGASHVMLTPWRGGTFDTVLWAAAQFGDWYQNEHSAFSAIAEGGYQWPWPWRPHLRAGFLHASGDDDPNDSRHGTFFPMLPTTPPAVLAGTFAQMNLRQAFAEVRLTPSPRLALSASLTHLSLAQADDGWYSGTGATAIRGAYFGFSGRSSFCATGLGTLVQAAADTRVTQRWRLKIEAGLMRGGDVIRRQFSGSRLFVLAVESRLAF
jgi:hypothetical protein